VIAFVTLAELHETNNDLSDELQLPWEPPELFPYAVDADSRPAATTGLDATFAKLADGSPTRGQQAI
jgi:hypothetical protein